MTVREGSHLADLDGMRGVLACLVMLLHFGLNTALSAATGGLLTAGRWELSVDFFFLLSGYVLARSFERRAPTMRQYFVRRFLRLAPVFVISTGVMIAIQGYRSLVELGANLFMVQSLIFVRSINFPGWSIPFELFLPAAAVLAVPYLRGSSRTATALLFTFFIAVSCIGVLLFCFGPEARSYWPRAVGAIGGGIVLYRLFPPGNIARPIWLMTAFAGAIVIMLFAVRYPYLSLLFPPAAALCIVLGSATKTVFSSAPLQALGRWSYSIYLLHIPVITAAIVLLGEDGITHPIRLGLTIGVIVLAALTYELVEHRFIQLGKKDGA